MTSYQVSPEDIIALEGAVLRTLSFDICVPSALQFCERYVLAAFGSLVMVYSSQAITLSCRWAPMASSKPTFIMLCRFILELSLPHYNMLQFAPSMVAASSVYLALKLCQSDWVREISPCAPVVYCSSHNFQCSDRRPATRDGVQRARYAPMRPSSVHHLSRCSLRHVPRRVPQVPHFSVSEGFQTEVGHDATDVASGYSRRLQGRYIVCFPDLCGRGYTCLMSLDDGFFNLLSLVFW